MKTAVYFENGEAQIVLTAESKWEEVVLQALKPGEHEVRIMSGAFYECVGGYFRNSGNDVQKSKIIRIGKEIIRTQ